MNYQEKLELIKSHELFWGISDNDLQSALTENLLEEKSHHTGTIIMSKENHTDAIGMVVKGVCEVKGNGSLYIGTLEEGNLFGCQSLFIGGENFPNTIMAKGNVKILYIKKEAVEALISISPVFAVSYIRYLSGRICFLHKRIKSFTAKSAESKLAAFLNEMFGDYKTFTLSESATTLSDELNIGRASLYRAFDKLINAGAIEKEGKTIRLINKTALDGFIQ